MNKKNAIIALIIIVCILIIAILLINYLNSSRLVDKPYSQLTDEERVLEENRTIELAEPSFMERSGFDLVKSDNLQGVNYDKIYSQNVGRAQVNMDYNGKKFSMFISKTKLFENTSDNEPIVHRMANTEVTYVLGDDGIKNYYYQKNNMYYSISTKDDLDNSEIESLIEGFDTTIGENY